MPNDYVPLGTLSQETPHGTVKVDLYVCLACGTVTTIPTKHEDFCLINITTADEEPESAE